ncbi:hypothetical protein ACQP2P_16135 [Dactylosporangium sp. CA-139114]|uniref:hypothetical protein n=1 Tax=Dactylosporangium sp. CA-139114 TaxID=3239931 RepID=UPI003D97023E
MTSSDRTGLPARVAAMLATPGPPPTASGWSYELKFDGRRRVPEILRVLPMEPIAHFDL